MIPIGERSHQGLLVQAASGFKRSGFGRMLGRIRLPTLLAAALRLRTLTRYIRMRAFERLADQLPAVP
ncbi:MAG: hypothetical protein JSW36_13470 [Burkholderiales bacterium]|nr:MAG: hypothetical protein JSW36_13470 [Burkholderiales bacterium]